MRYPAGEKLEIIHLVERSHLSVKRTLASLGISRPTFYRWLWRYEHFGLSGLEDRRCGPSRVWNRVPESIRQQVVELALARPELSSRELSVTFTDERGYFISEASVYRLLKAQDLIGTPTSPISRSRAGVGSISRPFSMTTRVTSSPGGCARR